ncbi:MAG: pilin [Candidatus Dojkabacteria bacterium]|nr:pilin [Candidatus Dojkabacteria bacterium]
MKKLLIIASIIFCLFVNFVQLLLSKNSYTNKVIAQSNNNQNICNCLKLSTQNIENNQYVVLEVKEPCNPNNNYVCTEPKTFPFYSSNDTFTKLQDFRISADNFYTILYILKNGTKSENLCTINIPECPRNYVKFTDFLKLIKYGNRDKYVMRFEKDYTYNVPIEKIRTNIYSFIKDKTGIEPELLCINKNSYVYKLIEEEKSFIFHLAISGGDNEPTMHTNNNYATVARLCRGNRIASDTYEAYALLISAGRSFGCCPSGKLFVGGHMSSTLNQAIYAGACCPPGYSSRSHNKCLPDGTNSNLPRLQLDPNNIVSSSSETQEYILGYPLGRNLINDMTVRDLSQINIGCEKLDGCMLVSTQTKIINGKNLNIKVKPEEISDVKSNNFKPVNTNNLIIRPTRNNLRCLRCYDKEETIGIASVENNEDRKVLLVCKGNGNVAAYNLINNSISDTLSYLSAAKSLSGNNSDLLKNCRETGGIYTFLGCLDTTPTGIITGLIRIALGTFSGIALLQLIYIGIMYQYGDEQRIKAARKQLISTILGIILLAFSVLIFRIIGVNIFDVLPEGSL